MENSSESNWWAKGRLVLIALVLVVSSTALLSFPLLPSGRLVLEEGDVAPRDIRAVGPITYESAIRTAEQQRLAEEAVEPVYTSPDSDLARQQLERTWQVLDYLVSVRADTFSTLVQRRAWVLAVPELTSLPFAVVDELLNLSAESWGRVQSETLSVVAEAMQQGVRANIIEETRQEVVPALVGLDLSVEEANVTVALAQRLIIADSFYDERATQAAQDQARENVPPVLISFESDEVIVREGQRVSAQHLEALRELGLQRSRTRWIDVIGYGVLAIAGMLFLGFFLTRFQPDVIWQGRKLLLLALLWVFFLLLARLMVPDRTVLRYLFPASALAMLAATTLGPQTGVVVTFLMGSAVGFISDYSLEMATFVTAGGLAAVLAVRKVDRLGMLFRAAFFVSLAQVAVLLGFYLPLERPDLIQAALYLFAAVANGVISATMALGGLFLIGPLFDVITTFRLIELSRPDHPLLQRLLRETPGTYHHSLMVANLAEQAAERLGANPLLTRVGAYYHDVGKISRPYFFVENQVEGMNPHDRLDPYTSVKIIMGHVQDGIKLARRYRLPSRVRAFIPEHHGTKRVSFFYERALKLAEDPDQVNEKDFCHKGPRPQSRETALVLLADGSEAIVRARRPSTPEELAQLIDEFFTATLMTGQLDECPITMRDLNIVRDSFVSTLKGVFHPRIRYQEQLASLEAQAPAGSSDTLSAEPEIMQQHLVEFQVEGEWPVDTDILRQTFQTTLKHQGVASAELAIVIANDEKLQELNARFRSIDQPTDVLAFPNEDFQVRSGEEERTAYLGDIVISYPRAEEQATQAGHSVQAELQLLVVHGVLHLLGFDDQEPGERSRMWAVQEEILTQLGVQIRLPD